MGKQSDIKCSSDKELNRDENGTTMNLNYENNYSDINENGREGETREVYCTYTQDDNPVSDMQQMPYLTAGYGEAGVVVDPTVMQTTAALNHSMMFQNQTPNANYSQFPMFNGINSMYGAVPQYYGGNMPISMNPYYDPYGIINPLASATLSVEKTKKKNKKFICC